MIETLKGLIKSISPRYQTLQLEYATEFKPRYGHGKKPHPELYDIVNANRTEYKKLLNAFLPYKAQICEIPLTGDGDSATPYWKNGFLPGLDIIAIYGLLAELNPQKYVEIGSGTSTKVAHKARTDHALHTEIVSIDPAPRSSIENVADRIIKEPFEKTDFSFLYDLAAGDVLFIDNSHRILPNSDSMVFFMEVLPRLKPGVVVHIHDIYLPYDYPPFMCDRFYSEQYGLAFYLLANPTKYRTILPNYFISEDQELAFILQPFWEADHMSTVERHGGSFWLTISE